MKRTLGSTLLLSFVLANTTALVPRSALGDDAAGKTPSPPPGPPTDAAKTEARERFDRGLKLFNEGDNTGALAEFKRAYELIANPVVLFNIGLTYAAANRPADATDALQKLVSNPGSLSADYLARAKQALAEQSARVAEIAVETNVPASIEVDNLEVAKTPLKAPLRVAGGSHLVGAIAPGHTPQRKEVTVAGGEKTSVKFDLAVMEGTLAHITLKSHLPAADVFVDGERVGKTPLATSLTVPPGSRKIEVRRAGYQTAKQDLTLTDGASGDVTLDPEEDKSVIATSGGDLKLTISETEGLVTIDGKSRGLYATPIRLAAGLHRVLIERGGFRALERDINVEPGTTTTVAIVLEPTPETRQIYVNHATATRTWSWIGVAGGVALAGGSLGYLFYNGKATSDAKADYDLKQTQLEQSTPGTICDYHTVTGNPEACQKQRDNANDAYHSAQLRNVVAGIGVGLGTVALGLGIYGLIAGDNPSKYDKKPGTPDIARSIVPVFAFGKDSGSVVLRGSF